MADFDPNTYLSNFNQASSSPTQSAFNPDSFISQNALTPGGSNWDAFKYGIKTNITSNVIKGLARTLGDTQSQEKFDRWLPTPEGYKPQGFMQHVSSLAGSLLDPTTFLVPIGKGLTLAQHLGQAALVGGALGAGQTASEQFAKGDYDPEDIIKSGAFGAAGGAALGGLTRLIPSSKVGAVEQEAMSIFEKPAVKGLTALEPEQTAESKEIIGLLKEKAKWESVAKNQFALSIDDTLPKEAQDVAASKYAAASFSLEKNAADLVDHQGSDAYKAVTAAHKELLSSTVTDKGQVFDMLDNFVSSHNKQLDPAYMIQAATQDDIPARFSSAWGWKDMPRIMEYLDKSARGFLKKNIYEPVVGAKATADAEELAVKTTLDKLTSALPDQSAERMSSLVDVIENKATPEVQASLTADEQKWVNNWKTTAYDLWQRENLARIRNGQDPVGFVKDYFSHAANVNKMEEWGLKTPQELEAYVSPLQKKQIVAGHTYSRTGEMQDYIKSDPLKVMNDYIGNALKIVHMTDPAAETQARAAALVNSPNLRATIDKWVNGAVMGGRDPKDASAINNGLQNVVKFVGKATNLYTAGVIAGNLVIPFEKMSMTLPQIMATGLGASLKGAMRLFDPLSKDLEQQSPYLVSRFYKNELPQVGGLFGKFNEFANTIITNTDNAFTRACWHAAMEKGKLNNLSTEASIRYADFLAQKFHVAYNDMNKPAILRGTVGRALFPFQTFTFNMWNLVMHDNKVLGSLQGISSQQQFAQMIGSMVATNAIFNAVGAPEPFKMTGVQTKFGGVGIPNVPLLTTANGGLPTPTLGLPYKEVEGVLGLMQGNTDNLKNTLTGNLLKVAFHDDPDERSKALGEVAKFGGKFLPMGQQIANSWDGIQAVKDGSVAYGKDEVPLGNKALIPDNFRAILLGPHRTGAYEEAHRQQQINRVRQVFGLDKE